MFKRPILFNIIIMLKNEATLMPLGPRGSRLPIPFYYYYYAQEIVVQGHIYAILALHAGIGVGVGTAEPQYQTIRGACLFNIVLKNEQCAGRI